MNSSRLVSVKNAVFDAFDDMGIDVMNDAPTFTGWAVRAAVDIGSLKSYREEIIIKTIEDCAVKLPSEVVSVKGLLLGDHGCECNELFSRGFSSLSNFTTSEAQSAFLSVDNGGETEVSCSGVYWGIQDGHIVFKSQGLSGQKVTIKCLSLKRDPYGFPMVSENAIPAIVEYIMYRFARRSRFSRDRNARMDLGDIKLAQSEYYRLASHARAEDAVMTDAEYQEVAQMINDPYVGRGIPVVYSPLF